MAFNPFHQFRKHQKVIFAVLTIMCMFVFVLSTGTSGDYLQRAKSWFGANKGQGAVVGTVYGKKYLESEWGGRKGFRSQRRMTNHFIVTLKGKALNELTKDPRVKADAPIAKVVQSLPSLIYDNQFRLFSLSSEYKEIERLRREDKDKTTSEDDRRYLNEVADAVTMMELFPYWTFSEQRGSGYFGSESADQMLDFEMWKHQADKLGIVMTPAAVREILKGETLGRDLLPEGSLKSNEEFRKLLDQNTYQNFTESDLFEALADEYRVLLAQNYLLGQVYTAQTRGSAFEELVRDNNKMKMQQLQQQFGGISLELWPLAANKPMPTTFTPGEFLQYFREHRTTVRAAMLPIPVEAFEKDLKDEPTEAQLLEFYKKFKDNVPSPESPTPGFMEPRTVRVQYLSVSWKNELYQNQAKKLFAPSTAMAQTNKAIALQVAAGYHSFPTGGGPAAWALTVSTPMAGDPVLREYGRYFGSFLPPDSKFDEARRAEALKKGSASGEKVAPDIFDPSYDEAARLGNILGSLTQGNVVAGPAALADPTVTRAHAQARLRAIGAVIMTGTSPTPGLGADLQPVTNFVQPLDKIDAYLIKETREYAARELVNANLDQFVKEVTKLQGKPAEAKEYIEKSAKEYDFHLETMTTAKDRWSISDDPALKAMFEAYTQTTKDGVVKPEYFASLITYPKGAYQMYSFIEGQSYPNRVITPKDQILQYWLVEDNQPKVRSFADAKPEVIKAWKHQEAYKLAVKKAREIEAGLNDKKQRPSDFDSLKGDVLSYLNQYKYGKDVFELSKVVRLTEEAIAIPGHPIQYKEYKVPEDLIKYPPTKITDKLLSLQKPGDATFLSDQPQSMVYVAVLLERVEPNIDEFQKTFARATDFGKRETMWNNFVQKQRLEFQKQFIEKLRKEASPDGGIDENGQWILPEQVRPKAGSS